MIINPAFTRKTIEYGYGRISVFFLIIALATFLGFYKKYFSLAPQFPGVLVIHHLHALALSSWLLLLIIQPLLILKRKLHLHRGLGKLSYILAPLMFISMLMAYNHQYHRFQHSGETEAFVLGFVFAPATDAIPFVIFYLLAMFNVRRTTHHMRYIIASGIVIAGPGLGRIFMHVFGLDVFAAIQIQVMVQLLVFLVLILYDRKLKKQFRINPYVIACVTWLIPNVLIAFFPQTAIWQSFARWLTSIV